MGLCNFFILNFLSLNFNGRWGGLVDQRQNGTWASYLTQVSSEMTLNPTFISKSDIRDESEGYVLKNDTLVIEWSQNLKPFISTVFFWMIVQKHSMHLCCANTSKKVAMYVCSAQSECPLWGKTRGHPKACGRNDIPDDVERHCPIP